MIRALALPLAVAALLITSTSAQAPVVVEWLDRYVAGQFDGVNAEIEKLTDKGALLEGLEKQAPDWIEAGGAGLQARRRAAAATLALEAARLDTDEPWANMRQRAPDYVAGCGPDGKQPPPILFWRAPARLLKWAGSLFEGDRPPTPTERWWRLAAVALAQRHGEVMFLRSDGVCLMNPDELIDFLAITRKRFALEPRFQMAEAIVTDALKLPKSAGTFTFEQLLDDLDVGGEAALRLGQFDRAVSKTRDPWTVRLARDNARARKPEFGAADYRFWPELIAHLRGEIAPPMPPLPAPPATLRATGVAALDALAQQFDRDPASLGATVRNTADLGRLLRDLRGAPSPWPDNPRHEAVFVLEVASAALWHPAQATQDQARMLLSWYLPMVRHPLGADAFECLWYRAEIGALEGPIQPAGVQSFIDRAEQRCPNDPRLALAAAVVTDQLWPLGTTAALPGQTTMARPPASFAANVKTRYARALRFPETEAEARVRLGWLHYRLGELDDASRLISGVDPLKADRVVLYLAKLMQGIVLRAQRHPEAARAEFTAALAMWPGAQSARVALMTLAIGRKDWAETESFAEAVQTSPATQFDPWWLYWQGDYRDLRPIMSRLRELAR